MDRPQTRFTRSGSVAIAYQVVGDGPIDLVYASSWLHNIGVIWEHPGYRRFLEDIASIGRLILFDKRGTGLSDRDIGTDTLEERAEDIRAVMDAAGSQSATVVGVSEGGHVTAMFAATYPERTRSIILIGCTPCIAWRVDWPSGWRRNEFERFLADLIENWGQPTDLSRLAPSVANDPKEQEFFARLLTQSASPASAAAYTRNWYDTDIRQVLRAIAAPALVIRRRGDRTVSSEDWQYLANNLQNGRLVLLDGEDHLPWIGDADPIVDEIRRFAFKADAPTQRDRVLLTVLMTDIAGSTEQAVRIGDQAWREIIEAHDRAAGAAVARHGGTIIKSTGDGLLATFQGPSRAIVCARELQSETQSLGVLVRAGIHTGECLRRKNDVSGLAVNISARIMDEAPGGEIWVSGTVRDLVVGSDLTFEPLGTRALKGVPGEWPLYKVSS